MRLVVPVRAALAAAAVLLAAPAGRAQPVAVGQTDTFSGSLDNWTQGGPALGTLTLASGGQGGPSDQYMQITASGSFGPGSHLTAFNQTQWTGDYAAAGVHVVEMDLFAPVTDTQHLSIRIAFKASEAQLSPGYISATAFDLPNDGQWHHAAFNVSADAMTAVNGPNPFDVFITNPAELRVVHEAGTGNLSGDPIQGVLGVDNITAGAGAAPTPEPAGALAAAAAAGLAWPLLRRRMRRTAGGR